jgi:GNAT superfamily N-acetyltransferase
MRPASRPRRALPDGVEVRPTRDEDRALLLDYFDRLPPEDRDLRFFGPTVPASHVDRWLALGGQGGETFIALTTDPVHGARCVGEAGYAPHGDGTAEFALSVAPDARGGLGTVLLEYLRDAAAARGYRALHGDILADNGPMRHLLRRRGGTTVDRLDGGWIGVVIATGLGAPPWPEAGVRGPRVLVESRNGRWGGEAQLREAGFQVAVCPGPTGRVAEDPCPLLEGRRCALVDGADIVVNDLSPDEPVHRHLTAALMTAADPRALLTRPEGATSIGADLVETALRAGHAGRQCCAPRATSASRSATAAGGERNGECELASRRTSSA